MRLTKKMLAAMNTAIADAWGNFSGTTDDWPAIKTREYKNNLAKADNWVREQLAKREEKGSVK